MSLPKHGLFLPPFDALADPQLIAQLAADAEKAGWDGLFLWDHMAYSPPVQAILDPWICLAAIAVATERITLGAMVTPLSRRRPAVVARQAVTLDLLSRGRLVLGFGLGDDGGSGEMSRFGEEPDPRIRAGMLDEGLFVLRRMLSGELVDHHGTHYTAAGVQLLPRPYRASGIPFWIGARWPNARPLRRAAKHDGAFVIALKTDDDVRSLVDAVGELRGGAGDFDIVVELPGDDDAAAWSVPGVTWLLTRFGPYDLDAATVAARIAAGPPR
jgi:alkanesulfonate monooxygenase SsuD/methylene tetrahydromethanopterin reductase-like flavin-dependent oxidoreductase (luciferase family)